MPRKIQHTQLPKGAKIYLPDEAAQKRRVEAELWNVFRKWGYREIVTSAYEYFDVLAQGTDQELQERMFKMVDRESGRLLALRADVTQGEETAALAVHHLEHPLLELLIRPLGEHVEVLVGGG